jgi:hypothetical protein
MSLLQADGEGDEGDNGGGCGESVSSRVESMDVDHIDHSTLVSASITKHKLTAITLEDTVTFMSMQLLSTTTSIASTPSMSPVQSFRKKAANVTISIASELHKSAPKPSSSHCSKGPSSLGHTSSSKTVTKI